MAKSISADEDILSPLTNETNSANEYIPSLLTIS